MNYTYVNKFLQWHSISELIFNQLQIVCKRRILEMFKVS